ncbi:MAG: hypothetical protein OHK0053_02320 [Microscillaceae bacterium]
MHLLYLHGLHARPHTDKVAYLAKYASRVSAPHLDYFQNEVLFSDLLGFCREEAVQVLVGSSAGGLMAYWLGQHLGLPALLFNPALMYRAMRSDIIEPAQAASDTFYYVVLGEQDEVIKPETTRRWLEVKSHPKNYCLDIRPALGHQIDLNTFQEAVDTFFSR